MRIAVFPGSFDPVTVGHMDLIARSSKLFDKIIVTILHNPAKKGCFDIQQRIAFLQTCCAEYNNVNVDYAEGLTVQYAQKVGACAMIRGLRSEKDFMAEQELAQINKRIDPDLETVFLLSLPQHQMISSSAVRQLASYGGDLTGFVPEAIKTDVAKHFHHD